MLTKVFRSFQFALSGLITVWQEEENFRIETVSGLVVIFLTYYLNFSYVESSICVLVVVMVLCAEILNTAVEDICNKMEPHHDPIIGKIKDIMAGFVLVTCLGAVVIAYLVFRSHFL